MGESGAGQGGTDQVGTSRASRETSSKDKSSWPSQDRSSQYRSKWSSFTWDSSVALLSPTCLSLLLNLVFHNCTLFDFADFLLIIMMIGGIRNCPYM